MSSNEHRSSMHSPMRPWNGAPNPQPPRFGISHRHRDDSRHGSNVNVTNVNHYGPTYFGNNIGYEPRGYVPRAQRPRRSKHSNKRRMTIRHRHHRKDRLVRNAGAPTMSESEEGPFRRRRAERSDSEDSYTPQPAQTLSMSLNVDCPRMGRSKTIEEVAGPDLTPLDDDSRDSSSPDEAPSNRWHLPLTDDDEMSVSRDDEMSVSLQRESKKERVDSGSVSKPQSRDSEGRQFMTARPCAAERHCAAERKEAEAAECAECAAKSSALEHLRGVNVSSLDMARLMSLENELLTALQRVHQAMASRLDLERMCVVCRRLQKDTVFRPCSHFSTCSECSKQLQKCPLCQSQIGDRFKVFQ